MELGFSGEKPLRSLLNDELGLHVMSALLSHLFLQGAGGRLGGPILKSTQHKMQVYAGFVTLLYIGNIPPRNVHRRCTCLPTRARTTPTTSSSLKK